MTAKTCVTLEAPAKLNLFLEVTGRRPDGFHELETLFAKISLCDTVAVARAQGAGIRLSVLNRRGYGLDCGPGNLAFRAAEAFLREFGVESGLRIRLVKRIPVGAGLGGGSSDAAAVLRALALLFPSAVRGAGGLRRLGRVALELGSDVPFFMQDAVFCVGRGRGEKLRPLRVPGPLPSVLLAYPGVQVSSASAYKALDRTRKRLTVNKNLNRLTVKLGNGVQLTGWGHLLYNRLEGVVFALCPEVEAVAVSLRTAGDFPVMMTGSGSCIFALIQHHTAAVRTLGRLRRRNLRGFVVKFLGQGNCDGNNGDTCAFDE